MTVPLPTLMTERLRALGEHPIEATQKGFGPMAAGGRAPHAACGSGAPLTPVALAAARPPVHAAGFCYPLLVLRETALSGNIEAMAAYCARAGVALAPHGKTAMSPELAARQLRHGAWGITVATIGQLAAYRAFGFPRLLLANELTDAAGIAWLAAELAADPGFEAYCYVDSTEGVDLLDRGLSTRAGRRLPVLVEIGHLAGRTGCRTDEQALAVARAAVATGTLRVAGVAGYEGSIAGRTPEETVGLVSAFCRRLRALADALGEPGPHEEEGRIVSAGGSAYFDVVARELTAGGTAGMTVILRSGAYIAHDHGFYASVSPDGRGAAGSPALRPALELWAQVLSRPEPGLALLGAGRRDVGFDKGLPRVPGSDGWQITELNDQHAYLRLPPGAALAPGDLVRLGISHPCTTLDKWRVIPVVDDQDRVTEIVHTFF